MPPGAANNGRSGGFLARSAARSSSRRVPSARRPTDLNDRGLLDKLASDFGTLLTQGPRALVNMAGAPISDLYALAPGGREAGTAGRATFDLGAELLSSAGRTGVQAFGEGIGAANLPFIGDRFKEQLQKSLELYGLEGVGEIIEQEDKFKEEHPGLSVIEDLGNVALGGAIVSKPLGAAARSAAGTRASTKAAATAARDAGRGAARASGRGPVGQLLSGSAERRAVMRQSLDEILESGGEGATLAEASRLTGDILGHPYRQAGRAVADARIGGRHSLREVVGQVRESAPLDRLTVTPEMKQSIELRRRRGEVDDLQQRVQEADPTDPAATQLAEELETRRAELQDLETSLGSELATIEQTRIAPRPLDDLTSPLAKDARRVLDTEPAQRVTAPFVGMRRATKGLVQGMRENLGDDALEVVAQRDPGSRRRLAVRALHDLDARLRDPDHGGTGLADAAGIELPARFQTASGRGIPSRWQHLDDGELYSALVKLSDSPELRAQAPVLDSTLDLTILDLAEQINDLPDGALRNQLRLDAELTPEIAATVRRLQREGGELPDSVRATVEDALGTSYRVADEQLANPIDAQAPEVQAAYQRALDRFREEGTARDVTLAEQGLGAPEEWALRVEAQSDGTFRPLAADESPTLKPTPSKAQARSLRKAGLQIKAARTRLNRIAEQAEQGRWAEKGGVFDSYRSLKRQSTQLARTLGADRATREGGATALNELKGLVRDVEGVITEAGFKLDDVQKGKFAEAVKAAEFGTRADVKQAARSLDDAGRAFEARLAEAQGKAVTKLPRLAKAVRDFDRVQAAFDEAEAQILDSIEAAPAVARPVLDVSRRLQTVDKALRDAGLEHVADDLDLAGLPQTLDDMTAAGVSPTFLRRIEDRVAGKGYRAASDQPLKTATMRSQRRRTMADMNVLDDIDRVKAETDIELGSRVIRGQTVDTFMERFGRTQDQIAEQLIAAGELDRNAWRDMTSGQRERVLTDLGFNAYVPDQIFSFKTRRTGPTDQWIPSYLNDALTEYLKPGPIERFLRGVVSPATTTWKHFILALRPAWHVYNVIGNAAMASIGGGVNVAEYLDFMRLRGEARGLMRDHRLGLDLTDEWGLGARQADQLLGGGVSRDLAPRQAGRERLTDSLRESESIKSAMESRFAQRASGPAGKARSGFNRVVGTSYRANAYMDSLNRTSMYLYETLRKGTEPEVALQRVNKVLGDYKSMTPTEKTYIRSVFPFYAWMRHITGLTAEMLKPDNITRSAILGTVVENLGDPTGIEAELPAYMAGDVELGNTGILIGMRGFNPWQDVLDIGVYNEEVSTRGALRSMHPLIQFGMERNSGIDTLTGRPFSRPAPVLDDLGREIPTAPPLGEHLFQNFAPPQANLLRDLVRKARGETTARYSTGQPLLFEGVREPSMLGGIGSFLGAPLRFPEVEGINERREEAMDRASRQIARYQQEVQEYEQQRSSRSLAETILPFGD